MTMEDRRVDFSPRVIYRAIECSATVTEQMHEFKESEMSRNEGQAERSGAAKTDPREIAGRSHNRWFFCPL